VKPLPLPHGGETINTSPVATLFRAADRRDRIASDESRIRSLTSAMSSRTHVDQSRGVDVGTGTRNPTHLATPHRPQWEGGHDRSQSGRDRGVRLITSRSRAGRTLKPPVTILFLTFGRRWEKRLVPDGAVQPVGAAAIRASAV